MQLRHRGQSELTWMERSGNALGVLGEPGQFEYQSISPDGKRVVVVVKPSVAREMIWIYDVDRGTRVPLDPGESGPALNNPVWSPDGKQIAYRNTVGKASAHMYALPMVPVKKSKLAGLTGCLQPKAGRQTDGTCWLTLRNFWDHRTGTTHYKCGEWTETGNQNSKSTMPRVGKFSPDGRWLAYSDETSGQLYVTPFPGPGGPNRSIFRWWS